MILPDGMNLNQELVKQGWCWWGRKYTPGDTVLEGLEHEAREAQKGLWADPPAGAAVGLQESGGQGYTRRIRLTLSLRVGSYGLDLSDDPPIKWRGLSPVRFSGCTM